jgi:exosortase
MVSASPASERKENSADLPRPLVAVLALAAGFMAFTAWNHAHWWRLKDDYVFGWLAPFFAAYVVYERWPRLVAAAQPGAGGRLSFSQQLLAGLAVVAGAGVFLTGALMLAAAGASYPASLGLSLGTAGITLGLIALTVDAGGADGRQAAGLFVFPALVWLVSAPMVSVVENALSVFLLGKITAVVFFVFESLGLALEQQGNVLVLPSGEVGVAEACSGIRSLMGCIFAGSFLGAVCFEQRWKKLTLLGAAAGFALLMNLVRSLILTGWAYRHGPESIAGRFHDWTGYAVILGTTLGLLGLTQILSWNVRVRFSKGE